MNPEDIRAIVRTTWLLEARSERYGDYLQRVLPDRFALRVARWSAEEGEHGRLLGDWLARHDPTFDQAGAAERFATLPYHEDPDTDRDPSDEALSRCVVEALASGFYRALGDATDDPELAKLCRRLMSDEARHFAGFRALSEHLPALSGPRRVAVILRRVRELDDDQIVFASHCADPHGPYDHTAARRRYLGRVTRMIRPEHARYVQAMLFQTLGGRPAPWVEAGLSRALLALARSRARGVRLAC
ncbi:MAG: ferritin-like domain-containing protein [Myxococcota bacterium]